MSPPEWRTRYDAKTLLAEVARLTHAKPSQGSIVLSFKGVPHVKFDPAIQKVLAVVGMAIKWPNRVSQKRRNAALGVTAAKAVAQGKLDEAAFLSLLATELGGSRGRPKKFFIVSDVSLRRDLPIRSRTFKGGVVRFAATPSPYWDRAGLEHNLKVVFPSGSPSKNYRQVAMEVHAHDPHDAKTRAADAFDLSRALWNLHANVGSWVIHLGTPGPVNKIVWGPLTTIHRAGGELATNEFWYSPEFRVDCPKPFAPGDLNDMVRFERWAKRRIANSPIRSHLESLLLAYVRALDEVEVRNAFMSLWAVSELLTGGLEGKYDRNLKRLLACYDVNAPTRWYLRNELTYLREFRNALVHERTSKADEHLALQQLMTHVHAGIKASLAFLHRQPTIAAAMSCLDLPLDREALKAHGNRAKLMRIVRTH